MVLLEEVLRCYRQLQVQATWVVADWVHPPPQVIYRCEATVANARETCNMAKRPRRPRHQQRRCIARRPPNRSSVHVSGADIASTSAVAAVVVAAAALCEQQQPVCGMNVRTSPTSLSMQYSAVPCSATHRH